MSLRLERRVPVVAPDDGPSDLTVTRLEERVDGASWHPPAGLHGAEDQQDDDEQRAGCGELPDRR